MRIFLCTVGGWTAGLAAYVLVIAIAYGEIVGGGDLAVASLWTAVAFAASVPLIYIPALQLLRRFLRGFRPTVAFALAAVPLAIAPTAFVLYVLGGHASEIVSPEGLQFFVAFVAAGAAFGLGYAARRTPARTDDLS